MSRRNTRVNKFWTLLFAKGLIVVMYLGILLALLYAPLFFQYVHPHKTLNVCAFTETFCPEALERFEQLTGVKVNLTYVELDEQIYAKFKINEGDGYDVINISDFMVHMLSNQGLLQPLDMNKLANVAQLNKRLLHQVYDVNNTYSMPHKWFTYGLIYDKTFFSNVGSTMTMDFVFKNPKLASGVGSVKAPYKICMLDSPQDSFFLAALYLFGNADNLTAEQYLQVEKLLIEQKKWVECYTLYTVEYFLLTGIVPIAIASSTFARKIVRNSDHFSFVIPPSGGILVIENLAIPKRSKNKDLAHQFINFMLSDAIARMNSTAYGWQSANEHADDSKPVFEQKVENVHIPLFSCAARAKIDEIWLEVGCA